MKSPLCVIRESHQSPWCVTRPGPCHHRAPVVAEKSPPPALPHPHLLSLISSPERERGRSGDSQTDRKWESRQSPCECVSYGTDLVLMTPSVCPPSATHSSNPHLTSLRPGQYHPFIRNAALFQLQCPMALPTQAPIHPPLPAPASPPGLWLGLGSDLSYKNEHLWPGLECCETWFEFKSKNTQVSCWDLVRLLNDEI